MTEPTSQSGKIKSIDVYIPNRERLKAEMRQTDGMSDVLAEIAIEFMTKFGNPAHERERNWRAIRIADSLKMQSKDPHYVFNILKDTYRREIDVYDKYYEPCAVIPPAIPAPPPAQAEKPAAPRVKTPKPPRKEKSKPDLKAPWLRASEIQVTVSDPQALKDFLMAARGLPEKQADRILLFLDTLKEGPPAEDLRYKFAEQLKMSPEAYDRAVEHSTIHAYLSLGTLPVSIRGLAQERPDLVQIAELNAA